ncbi:hypothetical protein [Alicyclobacillus macrosporangiidus]|nr:hypothetical protein [Alicyclobacillus macrosporangiidus]
MGGWLGNRDSYGTAKLARAGLALAWRGQAGHGVAWALRRAVRGSPWQ